jgi:hypothetical protein
MVQWAKDLIRTGKDPSATQFTLANVSVGDLLEREKSHENWVNRAKEKSDAAMPKQYSDAMKWSDWKLSFHNFLKTQPGRRGVPLNYIIRPNEEPRIRTNVRFLDDYVDQAPLEGQAYAFDAEEVHVYLTKLLSDSPTAEAKILPHLADANGRKDMQALCDFYEGVGANAKAILMAEEDIKTLAYSGEKKPQMWWDLFETRLNGAFTEMNRTQDITYADVAKLRLLNSKVNCDFLSNTKTQIQVEMANPQMRTTYDSALAAYRNAVNSKFPEHQRYVPRRIQEVDIETETKEGNGGGKGKGNKKRDRSDAYFIRCTDGTRLEVHPAYNFSTDEWNKIPQQEKDKLVHLRRDYKMSKHDARQASQVNGYYHPYPYAPPPHYYPPPNPTEHEIKETTTQRQDEDKDATKGRVGFLMGGRNEQARLRSKNPNFR